MKFIYDGIYYPYVGLKHQWENGLYKILYSKRFPCYSSKLYDYIPGVHFGIKCKLNNPKEPYKKEFLAEIDSHRKLSVFREFYDIDDDMLSVGDRYHILSPYPKDRPYGFVVLTPKECECDNLNDWLFVGTPEDVHKMNLLRFSQFDSTNGRVVNMGFDRKERKWCGWSHRAMACFGVGDKIFEEDISDIEENPGMVPFNRHGREDIKDMHDAYISAKRFAEYID